MSELKDTDMCDVDYINEVVKKVKLMKPKFVPIEGFYWWATDKGGKWVPVYNDEEHVTGGSESHNLS